MSATERIIGYSISHKSRYLTKQSLSLRIMTDKSFYDLSVFCSFVCTRLSGRRDDFAEVIMRAQRFLTSFAKHRIAVFLSFIIIGIIIGSFAFARVVYGQNLVSVISDFVLASDNQAGEDAEVTPVPAATSTPTSAATPAPTATPTATPTPSATPIPTATPTLKPTATPKPIPTPTPAPAAAAAPLSDIETMESQILDRVNTERTNAGLAPLGRDGSLDAAADARSSEIAVSFSHTRPNGEDCFSAFPSGYSTEGENIAQGQTCAQDVMNAWMTSDGHRSNILNAAFTKIGISCYYDGSRYNWVQDFAG